VRAVVDTLAQADEANETDNAAMRWMLSRESQPPAFVTGPFATVIPTGARVEWTSSEPAVGRVLHGFTLALGETLTCASAGTVHADTLATVPGVRHYYRIAATDTAGNSSVSAIDSFMVAPAINTPPRATIVTPRSPDYFAIGDTLTLDGSGADDEDPSGALRHVWQIERLVPGEQPTLVFSDSLTPSTYPIPDDPDPAAHSYRVNLIVADSHGLADTASVPVIPDIDLAPSALSLSPDPAQANVILIASFWIRNLGRMPAPTTHWMLTLDGAVVREGDAPLAALDSLPISHNWEAGTLAPGDHQLRVVVDTLGQVSERDEQNDGTTRTLTIESGGPVGVGSGVPHELRLSAARPQPASESVSFTLELPRAERVRMRIYDLQGRVVWSEQQERGAGVWTLRWPGVSAAGTRVARGVYVARVDVAERSFRRRLVLQ
jgi:hypothetical protein